VRSLHRIRQRLAHLLHQKLSRYCNTVTGLQVVVTKSDDANTYVAPRMFEPELV
jgi:hypothetical protein